MKVRLLPIDDLELSRQGILKLIEKLSGAHSTDVRNGFKNLLLKRNLDTSALDEIQKFSVTVSKNLA